ncbi:DDB1- and CUL4-associated factor 13-like, partial [Lampetra fluviatilis]
MKVKMLCRNPDEYVRETTKDIQRVPRSYEVASHPLELPREYTRALNSVKVQRLLAKPLVGSLGGHRDSVSVLATHPLSVVTLLSGACDGEVRLWNLAQREWTRSLQAHSGCVRGLVTHRTGETFYTVGDDKTIKQWRMEAPEPGQAEEPLHTIVGKGTFAGVDCHWSQDIFTTCGGGGGGGGGRGGGGGGGGVVEVWSELRSTPLRSYSWGSDSVTCVRFNPVETDILASCASDRNIVLYDLRSPTPLKKVIMAMRSNSVAWNPMVPSSFTVANEDHSLYSWDMRDLTCAT